MLQPPSLTLVHDTNLTRICPPPVAYCLHSIMNSTGAPGSVDEGALQYIREQLPLETKPVFLVVSIVNPHDVLFYPGQVRVRACSQPRFEPAAPTHEAKAVIENITSMLHAPALQSTKPPSPMPFTPQYAASGYSSSLLTGPILPPKTANESLKTKPFAQQFFQKMVFESGMSPSQTLEQQTNYVNFYGNLIKQSDAYLVGVALAKRVLHCRRLLSRQWSMGLEWDGANVEAPCSTAQPPLAPHACFCR